MESASRPHSGKSFRGCNCLRCRIRGESPRSHRGGNTHKRRSRRRCRPGGVRSDRLPSTRRSWEHCLRRKPLGNRFVARTRSRSDPCTRSGIPPSSPPAPPDRQRGKGHSHSHNRNRRRSIRTHRLQGCEAVARVRRSAQRLHTYRRDGHRRRPGRWSERSHIGNATCTSIRARRGPVASQPIPCLVGATPQFSESPATPAINFFDQDAQGWGTGKRSTQPSVMQVAGLTPLGFRSMAPGGA